MLYSVSLVVDPNTSLVAPVGQSLKVTEGFVRRVWVRWRWGSGNLCGARILRASQQIWPNTPRQWFPSGSIVYEFPEDYEVADFPYSFDIEAYNLDTTFSHELWVAFLVLRPEFSADIVEFLTWLVSRGKRG